MDSLKDILVLPENNYNSLYTTISFSDADVDSVIEMAWEDRTPFDAIEIQFGLKEAVVKSLMKKNLKPSSYKRWRHRVEHCKTKHSAKRSQEISRFKCTLQKAISNNKISKRR